MEHEELDAALLRAVRQQVRQQPWVSRSNSEGTSPLFLAQHDCTYISLPSQVALKQLRVSFEVVEAVGCGVTLRLHLHLPSWCACGSMLA